MKIKKLSIILVLFILVGPILDLLIGYYRNVLELSSLLTPGVIYRGLFLTPVFLFLTYHIRTRIRIIVFYFIFVFALSNALHLMAGYEVDLVEGVQKFLKVLFPIAGLGAMQWLAHRYSITNNDERTLWRIGGAYGLIIAISIIIFYLSGHGLSTYRRGFSSKAFFAQNSASVALVISVPMTLHYIQKYKDKRLFPSLVVGPMYLFSAFLIGTRAAIAGVPLAMLLFYLFVFKKHIRNIRRVLYVLILLIAVLIVGFLAYRWWAQRDVSYIIHKFRLLAEGEFRRRVPEGLRLISEFSLLDHLFGIGEMEFPLTENDLVDIYGKFGLATLIPLLLFFLGYYLHLIWIFLNTRRLSVFVLIMCFTFYIGHASLAGHALAHAQVNNLFMLVYYLAYREIKAYRQYVWLRKKKSKEQGARNSSAIAVCQP